MHGYEWDSGIGQLAEEMLKVEEARVPGTLPNRAQGWIASEWGVSENNGRARFYRLTREGRKQLNVENRTGAPLRCHWQGVAHSFKRAMGWI